MYIGRFFYWRAARVFTVAVAVVAAWLLPGETVNAAPPAGTPQLANFNAPTHTTTTLTVSPNDSVVTPGTPLNLVAKVTPTWAQGMVQFKDASNNRINNLGNPVPVSNATASMSTSRLELGGHALSAQFISYQPAAFDSSDSPPVIVLVLRPTTTTLSVSPPSPVRPGTPLKLDAKVTPATVPGTVQFKDGTKNLGNAVPVSRGTASGVVLVVTPGTHQLTAVFTPTNDPPTFFGPSASHTVTVIVK